MRLISYSKFAELRLADFLPEYPVTDSTDDPGKANRFKGDQIVLTDRWAYRERTWVGELLGFTQFLRLKRDPDVLRCISIDFEPISLRIAKKIISILGVAVRNHMTRKDLIFSLGQPRKIETFVPDRKSYEWVVGKPDSYHLSATVHESNGLIYFEMLRADYLYVPKETGC